MRPIYGYTSDGEEYTRCVYGDASLSALRTPDNAPAPDPIWEKIAKEIADEERAALNRTLEKTKK